MALVNNTMIIRRDLMSRTVKLLKEGNLVENIDRLPIEYSPRHNAAKRRCCIYKERAIIKYKMMPVLGFAVGDEKDELTPLSAYAKSALSRESIHHRILTVADEACTSCVKANYIVTNLCKGCVGSACKMNCPKDAISFKHNGQAVIDDNKCVNCGICQKACPYHSIVYMPVPCEEACPVDAIKKDKYGVEQIDESKCIYCGRCVNACPFGAIFEISNIVDVFNKIQQKKKVIAIVAPSIMGQYKASTGQIFSAIKQLGFSDVVEVARGAMITAENEAQELKEKLEEGQPFMTTSCCPGYIEAVEKHLPELKPFVSHTKSPMYYTAEMVKNMHPDALVVFVGPCIAKRKEAHDTDLVDYVMTFEELDSCFFGYNINMDECNALDLSKTTVESQMFGGSGGVTAAVLAQNVTDAVKPIKIDGLNKKSITLLKMASKGRAQGNFYEVMACEGGCIAGPSAHTELRKSSALFNKKIDLMQN